MRTEPTSKITSKQKLSWCVVEGGQVPSTNMPLTALNFDRCTLREVDMKRASIKSSTLHRCRLERVYLRYAQLADTDLTGSTFIECDLQKAQLTNCKLEYVTFDRCQLDYDNILINAPRAFNHQKRLLRSLRLNATSVGDTSRAQELLAQELEVERKESFAIAIGADDYYIKNYRLLARVQHAGHWCRHWILRSILGYGLRMRDLLRTAAILVLIFAACAHWTGLYRVAGTEGPRKLELDESLYYSVTTFIGHADIVPVGCTAQTLASAEGISGVLFLGFFAAAVYRRFSR